MIEALDSLPSSATPQIGSNWLISVAQQRVGAGETGFGDRSSPFVFNLLGNWSNPAVDDANISRVRKLFADLRLP